MVPGSWSGQPYGTLHLAGFQHLEPDDAVVRGEMLAQSDNAGLCAVVWRICGAHEQNCCSFRAIRELFTNVGAQTGRQRPDWWTHDRH